MRKLLFLLPVALIILTACPAKKDNIDPDNNPNERKIGYLFYTSFIDEYNAKLYDAFARFKAAGVTDLVVDLRYNHGGSINAASYLASLIAPRNVVQNRNVFSQLDFNTYLNSYYDSKNWSRKTTFGVFDDEKDPLGANLNLKTVYIIATSDSYSASELLTFCLRPYMNVVHIGEGTGGKFTASMTLTPFDDFNGRTIAIYDSAKLRTTQKDSLRNWAMQPIVAIYKDSKGNDFSSAGRLIPNVEVTTRENDKSAYKPIGDSTDYLLAAALTQIKKDNNFSSIGSASTFSRNLTPYYPSGLMSKKDQLLANGVAWSPNKVYAEGAASGVINTVSQFVYDGMSAFYKWADNMKSKTPTSANNDPVQYFESVLYPLDTQHDWSWITNDVKGLLADFSGSPVDFGWGLTLLWTDASKTRLIAIVKYVYPNTPASNAGLIRGDVITKINGSNITPNVTDAGYYMKLFGKDPISVITESKTVNLTPVTIETNPVYKESVFTIRK